MNKPITDTPEEDAAMLDHLENNDLAVQYVNRVTDTSNDGYYELKARPQFLNILTLKGKPIDPNRTILEQQNDPESVLYSANIRPDLPTEKDS